MAMPRVDMRIWSSVLQDIYIAPPYTLLWYLAGFQTQSPFHGRDSEAVTEDSHAWGLNEIYGLELPTNEGIKRCHWLKLLSPSTNAMNKIVTFEKFERYPSLSWTSWTSNVAIGITSFKMLLDLMFRLSSLIRCGMAVNRLCVLSYSQGELFTASRQKCTIKIDPKLWEDQFLPLELLKIGYLNIILSCLLHIVSVTLSCAHEPDLYRVGTTLQ